MVVLIHSKVFFCMVGSCQKRFCRLVHILSCLNSKLVKAQLEVCGKQPSWPPLKDKSASGSIFLFLPEVPEG